MKKDSKYNPEVAKILKMMEKKNRKIKTKIIKRYKLSKPQYLKLLEETSSKPFPYSPTSTLPPASPQIPEVSPTPYASSLQLPQPVVSRNSRMTASKSALTLLLDKAALSQYTRYITLDSQLEPTFNEQSRLTFGNWGETGEVSEVAPEAGTTMLPTISMRVGKTGSVFEKEGVRPKVMTRRHEHQKVQVFVRKQ